MLDCVPAEPGPDDRIDAVLEIEFSRDSKEGEDDFPVKLGLHIVDENGDCELKENRR